MKLLWPGSELQAKATGQPSAFAAGNADQSSGAGPNATTQSITSISAGLSVAQVSNSQPDATLTTIFDQLNGRTERTRERGAKAAAASPQAKRIQLVQNNFHDILIGLMDAGQLEVNGSKTVNEDNKKYL